MKKNFFYFSIFFFVGFAGLVLTNHAYSAPKKKSPAISITVIKAQIQKAKDIMNSLDNIFRIIAESYEIRHEVEGNNYRASVTAGMNQIQKAESALRGFNYREAHDVIRTSLQNFTQARVAILGSAKWTATRNERIEEWQRFITEVKTRIPEALEKSIFSDNNVNLSDSVLFTCAVPNMVPGRRFCDGKWEIKKNQADCFYLACVKGKKELPACAGSMSYVNRDIWKGPTNQKCCPGLHLTKTRSNEFMCQRSEGGVECSQDIDCPQPLCTEVAAFCMKGKCARPTCQTMALGIDPTPSDVSSPGVPAAPSEPTSACCLPNGSCSVATKQICDSMNGALTTKKSCAKNKCKAFTPDVPPAPSYYDKCVIDGMKDYKCSNNKSAQWSCECFNFSGQPVADSYYECRLDMKKSCPLSSVYGAQFITSINTRYRMHPDIQIFWDLNKPATSYMEYGETTSYGSVFHGDTPGGSADIPDQQHFLGNAGLYVGSGQDAKLRPDAIYHYRFVSTGTDGKKHISDDYTFSTTRPYGSKYWIMCKEGEVRNKTCVNGELVDMCRCTSEGLWKCSGDIATSCPAQITPSKVDDDTAPTSAPVTVDDPTDKAALLPVTPLPAVDIIGECKIGDAKYYDCPDKTRVYWCKCVVGEKWDCVLSPEKSCAVSTPGAI